MSAAIISGVFAVVLACLAWIFKNGSRRARLLSRIERYTQVLKDLPDGHPARTHLDAALAADAQALLVLTGWEPSGYPAPQLLAPEYPYTRNQDPWNMAYTAVPGGQQFATADDEEPDEVLRAGDTEGPRTPSSPPAQPVPPPTQPVQPRPALPTQPPTLTPSQHPQPQSANPWNTPLTASNPPWGDHEEGPGIPTPSPATPAEQPSVPPAQPRSTPPLSTRAPLQSYASTVLGLLATCFAIAAAWLAVDHLFG